MAICPTIYTQSVGDEGKINKYSHVKSFDGNTKSDSRARMKGTEGGEETNFLTN